MPDLLPNTDEDDLESLDEINPQGIKDDTTVSGITKENREPRTEHGKSTKAVNKTDAELLYEADSLQETHGEVIGLNTKDSIMKWHELGRSGLSVSGIWLVGASWNSASNELEEPWSQELMEQLPILNMVPVVCLDNGSYTARRPTSLCTTARSFSLSHPPTSAVEDPCDVDNLKQTDFARVTDVAPTLATTSRDVPGISEVHTANLSDDLLKQSDHLSLDSYYGDEMTASSRSEMPSSTRSKYYDCPVYEGGPDSSPRPPVLAISLPAGPKGPNYWVQRRVAMYLSNH
nr:uncharacterized protein LOC128700420 [Cherax quadricarinatus]